MEDKHAKLATDLVHALADALEKRIELLERRSKGMGGVNSTSYREFEGACIDFLHLIEDAFGV